MEVTLSSGNFSVAHGSHSIYSYFSVHVDLIGFCSLKKNWLLLVLQGLLAHYRKIFVLPIIVEAIRFVFHTMI